MINWAVGDGGDYADPKLAVDALVAASPLADDYTLTIISDVAVGGIISGAVEPNNRTVRWTGNLDHKGNHLSCRRILCAANAFQIGYIGNEEGKWIVDNLFFDGTGIVLTDYVLGISVGGNLNIRQDLTMYNCFVDGGGVGNVRGFIISALNPCQVHISNLKVWSCGGWGIGSTFVGNAGVERPKVLENTTVWNCGNNTFIDNQKRCISPDTAGTANEWTLRNVVALGADTADIFLPADSTMRNCASEDETATGQGRKNNVVAADEFQSLDDTESEFLFLRRGEAEMVITATPKRGRAPLPVKFTADVEYRLGAGILGKNGTAPTLDFDTDIAGEAVPGEDGKYSIGCHEQQYEWITLPLEG